MTTEAATAEPSTSVPEAVSAAKTLPQLLRAVADAYGEETAIVLKDEDVPDESISFAGLERQSAELARGLLARGVGKGARIGFICGNGPQFAIQLAAIARIGAVAIPISTLIRGNELVRVLRQSDVAGLIVQRTLLGKDYAERICEALPALRSDKGERHFLPEAPYLRWVVSSGENLPGGFLSSDWLTDTADSVSEEMLQAVEAEVHTTDQLIEIYTSGSMALPKGVKHNHGPIIFRAKWLQGMMGLKRGQDANAMLPMFWVGGLMMYLLPDLVAGAVTNCGERTLSNSRMAMGSVLSDDDLKLLSNQPRPWWGLGMSETIGPYSYGDEFRAEGYPVCAPMDHFGPGYEIRIADEEGQPVGDGEIGEMQIRGYCLTPGLHKIEREGYFTPDGYYHTGDMCLVEGTRVHFVGRGGDMIKSASSNVSPAEVEMELQSIDGVHNAYVVGIPDKERGQLVVAAVVPREGVEKLDFDRIEADLRANLSSFKVPRAFVQIARDEVPMLHSNKVARREIAKMMEERLGRA